ncbi:MAG: phosphomevalonate decarboxylase MvaD, partial [Halobacteriaceae archaeon]
MKATAVAHPIQGLVKYHGMRDPEKRFPYHDSISVCTAPSHTKTTVQFQPDSDEDTYRIDGEQVTGTDANRIQKVVERVRDLATDKYTAAGVRLESENDFPTNVGFGSSSSGFAAAAMALSNAANLDLDRAEISTIARLGSSSAARSVTGGFSDLHAGLNDANCRASRIPSNLEENTRIIGALIPAYKETEQAHKEAAASHMFQARLAFVHEQLAKMRDALYRDDFTDVFEIAEKDSLSLAATTMTGPSGWVYWQPTTIAIFNTVRKLRNNRDIPVYFSVDTGASVYINTKDDFVDEVMDALKKHDIDLYEWEIGGPARIVDG